MDTRERETCCICGKELGEGSTVLLTDQEGNKVRIDRHCRDMITAVLESEDTQQVQAALDYLKSIQNIANPDVQTRLALYIRKGERRLQGADAPEEQAGAKPADAGERPALEIGGFRIGKNALIAGAIALIAIVALLVILLTGGDSIVGKWQLKGVEAYGVKLDISNLDNEAIDKLIKSQAGSAVSINVNELIPVVEFKKDGAVNLNLDSYAAYIDDDDIPVSDIKWSADEDALKLNMKVREESFNYDIYEMEYNEIDFEVEMKYALDGETLKISVELDDIISNNDIPDDLVISVLFGKK